jgi:hypothetical protein
MGLMFMGMVKAAERASIALVIYTTQVFIEIPSSRLQTAQ